MSYTDSKDSAILDVGTGVVKCGMSSSGFPKSIIRTCSATPIYHGCRLMPECGDKDYIIGPQAQTLRGMYQFNWPMEHGLIHDWDTMDQIWDHCFNNELRVVVGREDENDEDISGVFLTEPPLNPHKQREQVAEHMFETFKARRLHIGIQGVLALYNSGRSSGVSLCTGDGVTAVVPVYNGFSMDFAAQRSNLGGRDVSEWLTSMLHQAGVSLETSSEQLYVQKMKEELCHVAMEFEAELAEIEPVEYRLPDGSKVTLEKEILTCPELLFNPTKITGGDFLGAHELIQKSVNSCDVDARDELLENIMLSGGNSLFKNFDARLKAELSAAFPNSVDLKVTASSNLSAGLKFEEEQGTVASTTFDVFNGACILSQLSTFESMWMQRVSSTPGAEGPMYSGWDEVGARCVPRFGG